MGEILPDGTIQGYQNYCPKCRKVINVNAQGNELHPLHDCIKVNEFHKSDVSRMLPFHSWLITKGNPELSIEENSKQYVEYVRKGNFG